MFLLSNEYWELRNTSKKGRGIFLKKDIAPGTIIGDYLGTLVYDNDFDEMKYGLYDLYFNETVSVVADPNEIGIQLINHSCSANCGMFPYKDHTLFFACRKIFKGEELTIQYLISPPEKNHVCQHACYCGSIVCHGTMHTSFGVEKKINDFVEKLGEVRSREILPGEHLQRLDSYPSTVSDDPIYDLFGNLEQEPFICNDASLPDLLTLREQLRETGRVFWYKTINVYIYGIMNGLIIGMNQFPV
jgi:hypothetical protein